MATSKWRSSLANVETRLRRSLGLTGPIDAELDPRIVPVTVVDDATRPGTGSELRGRRWRTTQTISPSGIQTGSIWVYAEPPYAASGARPNDFTGGVIIDHLDVTVNNGAAGNVYQLAVGIYATNLVLAPGIPLAVTTHDVYFVDPMRFDGEPAPLASGKSNTQTAYAARVIWEGQIVSSSAANSVRPIRIPTGDIFLNWNSCLVVGNGVASTAAVIYVNIGGRVF